MFMRSGRAFAARVQFMPYNLQKEISKLPPIVTAMRRALEGVSLKFLYLNSLLIETLSPIGDLCRKGELRARLPKRSFNCRFLRALSSPRFIGLHPGEHALDLERQIELSKNVALRFSISSPSPRL
jgi:hypothetical protein